MTKNWGDFYAQTRNLEFLIQNMACHLEMVKAIWEESPKKILEVGIGTASMSIFFSYLGLKVVGLDKERAVLKKAQKLNKKLNGRAKFVYGDAFKMPFKNQTFDVVFSQGLLEHFSDEDIIRLLNEQLRVGKVVVMSVPNNFYPAQDFGDERLLSDQYWRKLLAKYQIKKSLSYNPIQKVFLRGRIVYQVVDTMFLAKLILK